MAYGIFIATSVWATELRDAERKSKAFLQADAADKERMLKQEFAKFENTRANPANRDVNSLEYKLLSAYYNMGLFILAACGRGNTDEALELRNTEGSSYKSTMKKFNFDTANGKVL